MRKKSESNHASLSSTLTTFWANNSFVFEGYLIFFVKKSNNTYSIIRCDLRGNRLSGGVKLTHGERRISPKLLYKLKFARTSVGLHYCGLEKPFDFVLTMNGWSERSLGGKYRSNILKLS